ncbi:MAG: hypothetical protein SZ59_C0002G0361 [candidate division TM6 bacterium GW2011_GWF2_28_16]|nr:MAG: hypothetical protein SZ59_C0002G0361 [candidate division TM6 bacterium GW2011_GWF2_28_16]
MCKRIYLYIFMSLFFLQLFSMNVVNEVKKYNASDLHLLFMKNIAVNELKNIYLLNKPEQVLNGKKMLYKKLMVLDSIDRAPFFYCFLAPKLDLEMVKFLLENNAPIGKGALFADYKDIVAKILKYKDSQNNTIFHYAVNYKHLELIEFFVKNGEYKYLQATNTENKTVVNLIAENDIKFIEKCIEIFRNYLGDNSIGIEKYLQEAIFDKKSRCCCEQF